MRFILNKDIDIPLTGKAANLHVLDSLGLRVPSWGIVDGSHPVSDTLVDNIVSLLPESSTYAVRSSANVEDGNHHSYAGLFESVLGATKETLKDSIDAVYASASSPRVEEYTAYHKIQETPQMTVIVQNMIEADYSGVAFGRNPLHTDEKISVINYVKGLGDKLVSGEVNGHSVHVDNGAIINSSTKAYAIPSEVILEIDAILKKLEVHFGKPQDIEFCVKDSELYILQSRPITTLAQTEKKEEIVWDNSNIIESYPGVTLPLTFSFIRSSYEIAYKNFGRYLGVPKKKLLTHNHIFKNTLGLLNGRVYYNLKTWYQMLAMLPGYSINAGYMEKMMGVKTSFEIEDNLKMSRSKAWLQLGALSIKMVYRFLRLPQLKRNFQNTLDEKIKHYDAIDYPTATATELKDAYLSFEKEVLDEWKAPLLNDLFAMIWFGMLEKKCKALSPEENLHNDLLCGNSDIISTEPIHRTLAIATAICDDHAAHRYFLTQDADVILKGFQKGAFPHINAMIQSYIDVFGNRCMGELKLEVPSYKEEPELYIDILKGYVKQGLVTQVLQNNDIAIRTAAEARIDELFKGKGIKKWFFRGILRQARSAVSARENLRFERTRAYGIVRTLFIHMGKKLAEANIIQDERDIFYLGKEEIIEYIEGRSLSQELIQLVSIRKGEYEFYENLPDTAERIETNGIVYHNNSFHTTGEIPDTDEMQGIGCSPGIVTARVKVIRSPKEVSSLEGEILVTSSTDPGWVTLFPSAGGIIVERGSLLSHSAIVSREMGIPCIVSVDQVTQVLQTGDVVEMDGKAGTLKILSK